MQSRTANVSTSNSARKEEFYRPSYNNYQRGGAAQLNDFTPSTSVNLKDSQITYAGGGSNSQQVAPHVMELREKLARFKTEREASKNAISLAAKGVATPLVTGSSIDC